MKTDHTETGGSDDWGEAAHGARSKGRLRPLPVEKPRRKRPIGPVNLLIVYYGRSGSLKAIAEQIELGARATAFPQVNVRAFEVEDQPVGELRAGEDAEEPVRRRARLLNQLAAADALVVGSPASLGGMASPVKRLFEDCLTADAAPVTDRSRAWRVWRFRDKVAAAFTSTGIADGGGEKTLRSILTMFMHLGMALVTPGQPEPAREPETTPHCPTAFSEVGTKRLPSAAERAWARELGHQVVETALWLRQGREEWGRLKDVNLSPEHRPAVQPALLPSHEAPVHA